MIHKTAGTRRSRENFATLRTEEETKEEAVWPSG